MFKQFFILLAVTFVAVSAGAISRSGGGRLKSTELGFETVAPETFVRSNPVANAGLRLWSNEYMPGGPVFSADSYLEVRDYKSEFSELEKLDRTDTASGFAKQSWIKGPQPDPCVDRYQRDSATVTAVALVWGSGRGIVILGGTSVAAKDAIDEIANGLVLTSGSCGW